jgi:hypothetical protein
LASIIEEAAMTEPSADAIQVPENSEECESPSDDFNEGALLPSQRGANGRRECTPDELVSICKEIQHTSQLVKSHSYHLINYKNSFVGRELVDWLVNRKSMTREDAILLGKDLLRRHFIHHVTYEHDFEDEYLFYRFLEDIKTRSLNAGLSYNCIPRTAYEIADDLRKLINEIYNEHLSPDGFAVDYRGISISYKFEEYIRSTAELKRVDLFSLTRNQKIAFFLNIYNALVIHAFVVQGPPTNNLKRLLVSCNLHSGGY